MKNFIIIAGTLFLLSCAQKNTDENPCTTKMECGQYIYGSVMKNWNPPQDAIASSVMIYLGISTSGEVTSIDIDSVGKEDKNLEDSAFEAVKKASPFHRIAGLEKETYEKHIKNITLVFNVERQ